MLSFSQAPSRSTGPDQRDPALRTRRRAGKECKHEDIFKLFPALVIELLKQEAQRSVQPSPPKNEPVLGPQRPPTPTYIHHRTLVWASGQKFFLRAHLQMSCCCGITRFLLRRPQRCGMIQGCRHGGSPPGKLVGGLSLGDPLAAFHSIRHECTHVCSRGCVSVCCSLGRVLLERGLASLHRLP